MWGRGRKLGAGVILNYELLAAYCLPHTGYHLQPSVLFQG